MRANQNRNLFVAVAIVGATVSPLARAQTPPVNLFTPQEIATGSCWINSATGKRVATFPAGTHVIDMPDPNHVTGPAATDSSGRTVPRRNFVKLPDGSWIDSATGKQISTYPPGTHVIDMPDPNHVTRPAATDSGGGIVPGKDFVRIPCPPPQQTSSTVAAQPVSGEASYLGLGAGYDYPGLIAAPRPVTATVSVDYKNTDPNIGPSENSWGALANVELHPFNWDVPGHPAPTVEDPFQNLDILGLQGGYTHTDPPHVTTDTWLGGAYYAFARDRWRFGPAVGFQSSDTNGVSAQTWNYGGFAQWFVSDDADLFAKGGGFSTNPNGDGWYLGGMVNYYVNPDLVLTGGVDYTRWNAFTSYDQTSYSIGAEYLFSEQTPFAVFATYTYSDYSISNYRTNAINVGLRYYFDGADATPLQFRKRTGAPPPVQFQF